MTRKSIFITGSTDGIGLVTAKALAASGHKVLLHGRSASKLQEAIESVSALAEDAPVEGHLADLSRLSEVEKLAAEISRSHGHIDVLINNAGVFNTSQSIAESGLDVRFVVNTIAPYLLTKLLLPDLGPDDRVVNLSSAAQSPVNLQALAGSTRLSDNNAYAQSKLALTMWSHHLGKALGSKGPIIVAVNPKSLLGSKMVKEAFGVAGGDLSIGADILCRAALSEEFAQASGLYFDNDTGRFADPHPDALDADKCAALVAEIERILSEQ